MSSSSPLSQLKAALERELLARDEVRRLFHRAAAETSQRSLARQLGISQSAIAQRLSGYESAYDHSPLETMSTLAEDIREHLRTGNDKLPVMFRLIAQAITDCRSLTQAHDQRFFLREPERVGDPRWDALLAGLAAREARRARLPIPRWTTESDRFLNRAWFATESPGLRAHVFVHTPADFAVRNVYINSSELESV